MDEDANSYIRGFLEVYSMLKMNGVTDDGIRLRLSLFSLKGIAKPYPQALFLALVTTWEQLVKAFLA